jgi:heptosyltransferase-2
MAHQGLGDAILMQPLLRACGEARGEHVIIITRFPSVRKFIEGLPWGERVEIWSMEPGSGSSAIRIALKLRRLHPDILIFPNAVDRIRNLFWVRLTGAATSIGPDGHLNRFGFKVRIPACSNEHRTSQALRYARAAGLKELTDSVRVEPSAELRVSAKAKLPGWNNQQSWIALAPGSGQEETHKRWQESSFVELARMLLDHSPEMRIVVIGSRVEMPILEKIGNSAQLDGRRILVATPPSVAESVALLENCRCLVTNCSGVSHIGAAAGIPIVGLYGPTNPGFIGPGHGRLWVLRANLGCSPCYTAKFRKGCGTPICMQLISVETVFDTILDVLCGKAAPDVPWLPTRGLGGPTRADLSRLAESPVRSVTAVESARK